MENITLISCYYNINSKQPHSTYLYWMKNLLNNINTQMVIYCDKLSFPIIQEMRKNKPTKIIITEISEFLVNKFNDAFKYSHLIDIEKNIHSIQLYKVWNEKVNFIKRTIDINPFNSDNFYWIDIGCFRTSCTNLQYEYLKDWPNRKILNNYKNKIILFQTSNFLKDDEILDDNGLTCNKLRDRLGGRLVAGFFGGEKKKMLLFHKLYYEMLQKWIYHKYFIGKENYLMTNVYLQNKELFHLFTKENTKMNNIKDSHMWFQNYLC